MLIIIPCSLRLICVYHTPGHTFQCLLLHRGSEAREPGVSMHAKQWGVPGERNSIAGMLWRRWGAARKRRPIC